jgi:predicted TPR repeat methyltransferase
MKGLTRLTTDGSSDGSIDSASRATMPSAYVRTFFDGYAPYYEQHLVDVLGYRGHEAIASAVRAAMGGDAMWVEIKAGARPRLRVLDVGCGTGLVGASMRATGVVGDLIGVDVSPDMVATVEETRPKLYTALYVGDLGDIGDIGDGADGVDGVDSAGGAAAAAVVGGDGGEYGSVGGAATLRPTVLIDLPSIHRTNIDVITAAEVFGYVGNLRQVLPALAAMLSDPHGVVAFTLEVERGEEKQREGRRGGGRRDGAVDVETLVETEVASPRSGGAERVRANGAVTGEEKEEREGEREEEREGEREGEVHGYRLGSQGRFVFSERYIDSLIPQLGLEVVIRRVGSLRSDDQRSVVYVVRRRVVLAS